MIDPHNGTLFSIKGTNYWHTLQQGRTSEHYAERSQTKDYIVHDSVYMNSPEKANLWRQISGCLELGVGEGVSQGNFWANRHKGYFGGDRNVKLDCGVQLYTFTKITDCMLKRSFMVRKLYLNNSVQESIMYDSI